MIPSIETIVEDLLSGVITKQRAITWLYQHAEDASYEMRDSFACAALASIQADYSRRDFNPIPQVATRAYELADAMMAERSKP